MLEVRIKPKNQRIFELDFIRGTLIILMCLQHLCWFFYRYLYCGIWNPDVVTEGWRNFGELTYNILYGYPYNLILMSIAWCIFFLMAGISLTLSKNNYKRALQIGIFFIFAYIVAALCQNFFQYPVILNFGIFFGYAFYIIVFQLIRKFPLWFHIALSCILLILAICCYVFQFNIDIIPLRWFGLSQKWNMSYLDEWLLMPSFFFFSLGGIFGRTIYKNKFNKLQKLNEYKIFKPILWVGRNSMIIYIANIIIYPIIFIILTAIINGGL